MIDQLNVRSRTQALRTRVVRGLAVGSLLALGLGASGAGQALAAPSLDPTATYTYDSVQQMTVVLTPSYAIGPWQTIRQTYDCGGYPVSAGPGDLIPFQNQSSANVTATLDGGAVHDTSFSMLFTNWNFVEATFHGRYYCVGNVQQPGSQPPAPQPTPAPMPTPTPQPIPAPQPAPVYAPSWYYWNHQGHW